jgi:mevalonate kinase
LRNSFGGSGYDVACAQNDNPLLYQLENNLPEVEIVNFQPKCADNLYFVYLNQKQSSKSAIALYYKKNKNKQIEILKINSITKAVIEKNDFDNLSEQLQLHENIMSAFLEISTIKLNLFSDFKGVIKSLGAWGGDFVLAISKDNPTEYFKAKGFETIISYNEMILK